MCEEGEEEGESEGEGVNERCQVQRCREVNEKDGDEDIAGCWVIGRLTKLGQKEEQRREWTFVVRRISRRTVQGMKIVLCCCFESPVQIGRSTLQSHCCEWTGWR